MGSPDLQPWLRSTSEAPGLRLAGWDRCVGLSPVRADSV